MPPRQPLKLSPATGKATVKKRPVSKAAPIKPVASQATTEAPASVKKPAYSAFSLYPDLTMAIAMLEKRRNQVPAERAELIDKWLVSLNKVQHEMTHLRKLEGLTSALSRPVVSNINDTDT